MSALFSPTTLVVPFENLRMTDVEVVGGKNASLGEMISQLPQGVRVPTGFATTAHAFREFLKHGGLNDRINAKLNALDTEDVRALATVGASIRSMVQAQPFPADLEKPSVTRSPSSAPKTPRPRSPCVPRPRPKTCLMPRSRASRRLS